MLIYFILSGILNETNMVTIILPSAHASLNSSQNSKKLVYKNPVWKWSNISELFKP